MYKNYKDFIETEFNNYDENRLKMPKGEEIRMKNSKNKLAVISLTAFLMLFGLISVVNAAIDCNLTSITTINQFTQLNATFNTSSDSSTGSIQVAFELRDTANHINSSYSVIGNVTNTSNLRHVNLTFGNNILFPDADYADLRATCYMNGTSALGAQSNTGTATAITAIKVDRSTPVVSITTIPTTINTSNAAITITFSVTNGSSYVFKHTSDADKRDLLTSNLVSQSFTQTIVPIKSGTTTIQVVGDDGTNTTTVTYTYSLAGNTFIISNPTVTTGSSQYAIQNYKNKMRFFIPLIIGTIGFLFVVILVATQKKKKRR